MSDAPDDTNSQNSSIVQLVNDTQQGNVTTERDGKSPGFLSGQKSHFDPYEVHRNFPARWQAYIEENYTSTSEVMRVFQVSEKTVRNWLKGKTGANGGHVAIAVNEHPDTAPVMLFAAE